MGGHSKKGAAWGWRRLALGTACLAGLAALGYAGSRFLPHAQAQAPAVPTATAAPAPLPATPSTPVPAPAESGDYAKRPVAFIHDNEVVTREQLGEYLIARFGAERLPLLINKILIEEACRAKGIEVTAAEVEASFAEDLAGMGNISQADFADKVLKQYKKSLYEWKEDVIRPKLLMSKLVRDRVKVTEEDIQAGFEAYHGEKIDCQLIYWPKGEENIAQRQYAAIRDSEKEFDDKAKMQANSTLAATGGRIPPIGRHTTGNDVVEREAFKLQPGEISACIPTPDGTVVIKCVKRIPPDTTVSLERERPKLFKEVFEKKTALEIRTAFLEIQKDAKVKNLLANPNRQDEDLTQTTRQLLQGGPGGTAVKPASATAPR